MNNELDHIINFFSVLLSGEIKEKVGENMKKVMCFIIAITIMVSSVSAFAVNRNNRPVLSSKKVTIKIGEKKSIKLENVKSKVKWKITTGKKIVSIQKKGKYKNKIVIMAKKEGKAVIKATYKKKVYKVKVTVTKKNITKEPSNKLPKETTVKPQETTLTPEISSEEETTIERTEHEITAELEKNVIIQGKDLLKITYIVKEGINQIPACYVYTSAPLSFQRHENGRWVDVPVTGEPFKSDYIWISPSDDEVIMVDLAKHYGKLPAGRYRYTKRFVLNFGLYPVEWSPDEYVNGENVEGKKVSVEFDLVDDL